MSFPESRIEIGGTEEDNSMENKSAFNFNKYATKKTISKGLLSIGLLSSNATQLKKTISEGSLHDFFIVNIVLIAISIVLQLVVAILLAMMGFNKGKHEEEKKTADKQNNVVTGMVAIITVINIFINAFSA